MKVGRLPWTKIDAWLIERLWLMVAWSTQRVLACDPIYRGQYMNMYTMGTVQLHPAYLHNAWLLYVLMLCYRCYDAYLHFICAHSIGFYIHFHQLILPVYMYIYILYSSILLEICYKDPLDRGICSRSVIQYMPLYPFHNIPVKAHESDVGALA